MAALVVRRILARIGLAVVASLIVFVAVQAVADARKVRPRILAQPSSASVGETVTLTGSGFPVNAEIELSECASKRMVFLGEGGGSGGCTEEEVVVQTGPTGAFSTPFDAQACKSFKRRSKSERCWVGVFEPDADVDQMIVGVRIDVSP